MKHGPRGRERRSRNAVRHSLLASLLVLAVVGTHHVLSSSWLYAGAGEDPEEQVRRSALNLTADSLALHGVPRAHQVLQLEKYVDAEPRLGICHGGAPVFQEVPSRVCKELQCLWSEALKRNIDMWLNPLVPLPDHAVATPCPSPAGGQRGVPRGTAPVVSFIITMHNHVNVTMQTLLELYRTAHEAPSAEFILVDDGTTEDTEPIQHMLLLLRAYFGASYRYARNEKPVGYGPANTQGIALASGEFVALINNDMLVVRGWLTAIMRTFQKRPTAGIVGPMFIGTDNLMTEAGGLVYKNGAAANTGRGQRFNHQYNFLRSVDYVSGACIVFRKQLFLKVGGFDPRYVRGYYEDTDFAMAVAASGLEVLMQPLAVVYHQEGTTFGTDATSELKQSLMAANRKRFQSKWASRLQAYHCPESVGALMGSRRATSPAVLWVDDIVPEPDRDSGSIRNINIMKMLLSEGYGISFLPTVQHDPAYEAAVREIGVEVLPVLPPEDWQLMHNGRCMFDVVFVARRMVFQLAKDALRRQCPDAPIIYDTVDIHFLREARDVLTGLEGRNTAWDFERVTIPRILEWLASDAPEAVSVRAKRDLELSLIDAANLTLVVSPDEVDIITTYRPSVGIAVVSNIHEMHHTPGGASVHARCEARSGLLFVGNMNHLPNQQAVEHLILELLPMMLQQLPEAQRAGFMVHVVGANMVPEWLKRIMADHKQHVTFHGYLSDDQLRILYHRVRLVVAPLLSGAGVKGKVNQAMKYGVPVVATPLAVEGMYATDGADCMVALTPQEFVSKSLAVYTDCGLWEQLVQGGYTNLRQHFSYEHAKPILLKAYSDVGRGPLHPSARAACKGPHLDAMQ